MPPTSDPVRRQTANPQTPEEESPQTKERDTGRWKIVSSASPEEVQPRKHSREPSSRGRAGGTDGSLKQRQGKFGSLDFWGEKKNTEEEGRDCVVAEEIIGCQKRSCSDSICAETSRQVLTQPGSSVHQETANWGNIYGTGTPPTPDPSLFGLQSHP